MRRIFLDMDGVLADFDGAFLSLFGKTCEQCESKNEMWRLIHGHDEFFYNLPKMEGAIDLYDTAVSYSNEYSRPIILTSAGSSDFHHVAQQKRRWIQSHIDNSALIITVKDGLDKAAFVHNAGDILIDDWRKNCEAWEAVGGVSVKYENYLQAINDMGEALTTRRAA